MGQYGGLTNVREGVQACTPRGNAEGGAKVTVCEGKSRCAQPKGRRLTLSPRYQPRALLR